MTLKIKTIIASIAFSCISLADHTPRVPSIAQENLVERTRRLARMTLENVDVYASRMDEMQLRRVNELLRGIQDVVRETAGGGTQPPQYPAPPTQPVPPSYPPAPPAYPPAPPSYPGARMSIAGAIENVAFNFQVSTLNELYTQCTSFVVSKGISQVDDITVSINYGTTKALRNGPSYWRGANQICNQIVPIAKTAGLAIDPYTRILAIGLIESREFQFSGNDIPTIADQCTQFVERNGLTSVDDISVSVNFGAEAVLKNSTSYWRNSFEICQQIIQQIR